MSYSDYLSNAVVVTTKMLEAAKSDDWEIVVQLEIERQLILDSVEKTKPDSVDSSVINKLKILIELNDELAALSAVEKAVCFSRFTENKTNKKAFQTYAGY